MTWVSGSEPAAEPRYVESHGWPLEPAPPHW